MSEKYIDFQVAPWALPKVCEALYNNGITDGAITTEDDEIHIRWKYKIDRFAPRPSLKRNDLSAAEMLGA